ncbi:MAG TPA: tetratricopeptide repeat protein [Pirellulales bacterium]|nr:tetratricopeptide repeat protein [Pirellulales bacterium]
MHRHIAQFVLPWLLVAPTAFAADGPGSDLTTGCVVLARRPGVQFRIETTRSGPMHAGLMERVQKVQGDWLWLGRGWVQRRDVVPIWEAVEYFTVQIEQKPTAFAHTARAAASAKRGAFPEEADGDIAKALALDPDFASAHWQRGLSLAQKNDFERAIKAYDEAIRLDPGLAQVYHDRGHAWWATRNVDRALKDFDQAVRVCPRLASAYASRGLLLHFRGQHEQAFAEAREAVKHDPANAMAHVDIGWYWSEEGDDERAIAAYTEAIRVDRTCGQARLQRGRLYSLNGEYRKAVVDLNQAVQLMPGNIEALEARAYVYYELGAAEKSSADRVAIARLRRAGTAPQPAYADSPDQFVLSIGERFGDFGKSEDMAGDVTVQADSVGTTQMPTPTIDSADDHELSEEAIDLTRLMSRVVPLNNAAWRAATSADERYLDGARAVEFATEACELTEWQQPAFIDTLAAAYAEAGDFDSAIKWQAKAVEMLPEDTSVKAQAEDRLELYRAHKPYREDRFGRLARDPRADDDVQ